MTSTSTTSSSGSPPAEMVLPHLGDIDSRSGKEMEEQFHREKRRRTSKSGQPPRKSKRREKYVGWPEDLRKAHSLVRRMIRPVIGYRTPTNVELEAPPNQMVLDLCRKHPMLAKEKFLAHNKNVELSPLKFLIHNKAKLEVITGFCQSFPEAVQQLDGKNDFFNLDGYPLHLACTIRQDEGELIAMLARSFPAAVSFANEGGFLPLHLLLEYRGITPSLKGVEALVAIDPETTIRKPPTNPPPVFSILASSHLSREHMECIYSNIPRHVIKLDFPNACFPEDCFHLVHAHAIARVLPQLREMNLQPAQWAPDAWLCFVQAFQQHGTCLRKLAVKPPALRADEPPEVRTALFQLLHHCTTLETLDLQLQATLSNQRVAMLIPDLTVPMVRLLRHERLVSLRILGYSVMARPIFETLAENTQLRHLILNNLIPETNNNNDHPLKLSSILENGNVTLQQVQIPHYMNCPLEPAKITHYTRLNRLGRAAARDHQNITVPQLASMLLAAQLVPCPPMEGLGLLYGLLRESPGSWSRNNETHYDVAFRKRGHSGMEE